MKPYAVTASAPMMTPIGDERQAGEPSYAIFVHDLVLPVRIGVWDHEKLAPQRVRFTIDLTMDNPNTPRSDDLGDVMSYDMLVDGIKAIIAEGHIQLVETLAERIADLALKDPRTQNVSLLVEKLEVLPDGGVVGVKLMRQRTQMQSNPWANPWAGFDSSKK